MRVRGDAKIDSSQLIFPERIKAMLKIVDRVPEEEILISTPRIRSWFRSHRWLVCAASLILIGGIIRQIGFNGSVEVYGSETIFTPPSFPAEIIGLVILRIGGYLLLLGIARWYWRETQVKARRKMIYLMKEETAKQ